MGDYRFCSNVLSRELLCRAPKILDRPKNFKTVFLVMLSEGLSLGFAIQCFPVDLQALQDAKILKNQCKSRISPCGVSMEAISRNPGFSLIFRNVSNFESL